MTMSGCIVSESSTIVLLNFWNVGLDCLLNGTSMNEAYNQAYCLLGIRSFQTSAYSNRTRTILHLDFAGTHAFPWLYVPYY